MGARGAMLLLLAVVIVTGLLRTNWLATPAGPSHGRPVELAFWNGFTGPDGVVMLGIVRAFNEANPDVHVTMQRMDWATYYNKVMVASVDGRGPEVFVIHASALPRNVQAGFVDEVDDVYLETGPALGDFDEVVLEQLRYGGHYAGLALDVHPQGLYVNLAMLRAAGVEKIPATGEELVAAARKMMKRDAAGNVTTWGYSLTNWRWNFWALVPQYGGRLIDDAGRPTLNTPANVAALTRLTALVREEKVAPDPENNLGWVGFRQQKIGMVVDGVFMLGDLQRMTGLEYVGAPTPQLGPWPGTHGDSHVLCVRKGISAEAREASIRFLRFVSGHSLEWAKAGQVPARKSVRATAEFGALQVQSAFAKQIPYVRYPPRTPILFELQNEIDVAVERALRGRATPEQALTEAQNNLVRFTARANLERANGEGK